MSALSTNLKASLYILFGPKLIIGCVSHYINVVVKVKVEEKKEPDV